MYKSIEEFNALPKQEKWFEISADELEHRMALYTDRSEFLQKATALIDAAIESVLETLGVNVKDQSVDINFQCQLLGISINTLQFPDGTSYPGIFISILKGYDLIPIACVESAVVERDGKVLVKINFLQTDRLNELRGGKVA